MAQNSQLTGYIPTTLLGVNFVTPTLAGTAATGIPIPTGAFPGNIFYLTEQQANQASQFSINGAVLQFCHAGWYGVVQVAANAVAANIKQGAIGAAINIPLTNAQANAATPPTCLVTDGATAATAGLLGLNPVIFLGAVTPGFYTIVQFAGDANVLLAASQTVAAGALLASQSPGAVVTNATFSANTIGIAEIATATPAGALTLSAVAAASGGSAVYTGTITGGVSNAFAGQLFTVTGFTGAAAVDNGTYVATASTTTTLTLSNPNAVAVTAAGTATSLNFARVQFQPPFGAV